MRRPFNVSRVSEQNSGAELDLARRSRGTDQAESRRAERCAGVTEVGVVERVEELAPEFRAQALGHTTMTKDGKVDIHQAGPADYADAGMAKGLRRRLGKRCSVEPRAERSFLGRRFGFDTDVRRWAPAENSLQLFVWVVTVFGAPVWNVATLLCDHPSAI